MAAKQSKSRAQKARLETYRKVLADSLNQYESSTPTWFSDTVLELIRGGLWSLRHFIEDPKDGSVTWANPFAEFRYPVKWNWKAWERGDTTAILQRLGTLTPKNLRTKTQAARTLTQVFLQVRNVTVLNMLTKYVGWEKHHNRYTPMLSNDTVKALSRLSRSRQRQALTDLYKPFCVGAANLDYDVDTLESHKRVPGAFRKALSASVSALDAPPLTIHGKIGGESFTLSLIAQFHPFVVDVDERKAYFPIVVGLVFHPTTVEVAQIRNGQPILTPSVPDPSTWPRDQQAAFWEALFRGWGELTKHADSIKPAKDTVKPVPQDFTFKGRVVPYDDQRQAAIVNGMIESISQHGRIEHVEFDMRPASPQPSLAVGNLQKKIASGQFDVLLAHNSRDKSHISRICEHLKCRGVYPWFDQEQIPPGQRFQEFLQQAIRRVRSAAILIGPHGLGRWQALELEALVQQCVERKLPVIPVLLPGQRSIPKGLAFLRGFTLVRFERNVDETVALDKLQWGITQKKPSGGLGDASSGPGGERR